MHACVHKRYFICIYVYTHTCFPFCIFPYFFVVDIYDQVDMVLSI